MKSKQHFDVIVIGGGSSGMMAAGTAAANGKQVLLLEKNTKMGEKLKITGGGRCNITNAEFDTRKMLQNYGEAGKYLFSAFAQFGVQDTFDFFTSRDLPLVIQARKRAFPETERAIDVYDVMDKYVKKYMVTIKRDSQVVKIRRENNKITGVQLKSSEVYTADSYIIATGGQSHPETGSTGDGFDWLRDLGHTVAKPSPNIVPLATSGSWSHKLSGTSLSFMKISFFVNGKKAFSETGKLLFTHFGLSGPLILNSAKKVADLLHDGDVTATIDAYPDTDLGSLDKKILKILEDYKNKMFKNALSEIVPKGTSEGVLELLAGVIDPEVKVHSMSADQRKYLVRLLKALPIDIVGLMGFDRAVVADGGVLLDEIDMRTMRSQKVSNMFVTGDLLHVNRPSGGFSLQLCWTTGYVAGMNV